MGTVIGPIGRDDWTTMQRCKSNVKFYRKTDPTRFQDGIAAYSEIYNKKLRGFTECAVA